MKSQDATDKNLRTFSSVALRENVSVKTLRDVETFVHVLNAVWELDHFPLHRASFLTTLFGTGKELFCSVALNRPGTSRTLCCRVKNWFWELLLPLTQTLLGAAVSNFCSNWFAATTAGRPLRYAHRRQHTCAFIPRRYNRCLPQESPSSCRSRVTFR